MDTLKPAVRVTFCDFPGPTNIQAITKEIERTHKIIIDNEDPEYVIYSVFGNEFLKYTNAVRIFFTGENVYPDFNLCDYAFGFAWMTLEDRYCRCPNFLLYDEFLTLRDSSERGNIYSHSVSVEDREFCNFIYSNSEAHPFRDELFKSLSSYKRVHSAGRHLNNTGFSVGHDSVGVQRTLDKIAYQTKFKFTIAAENSSTIGYTTEKLIHALAACTIPIYWGDPEVGRQFNTNRMVNCHEFSSIEQVVERIIEIDQNETIYRSMLNEPIFPGGVTPAGLRQDHISVVFNRIFDQPLSECRRRNSHVWGRIYEDRRRDEVFNHLVLSTPGQKSKRLVKRVLDHFRYR